MTATTDDFQPPTQPNQTALVREGAKTVSVTIDGQTLTVDANTNILEAAKLAGKDICHFCYHQGLRLAASCRQCLVEVDKMPKLVPSCQQSVQDGMVVHTESEKVLQARQAMLEFTLLNHPIDCPICDKAGECTLQRHYMDHDHSFTRSDVVKIRKPKVKDIGKHIILDAERCILCSRCIRFCQEVPGTSELTMVHRGDHEQVDVAEGKRLDNAYSLNVVDVCPVGALTSKDFRFQVRAWELRATNTTCTGCATGCAVELHTKNEQAYRLVPRFDEQVNGHWMCDEGRFTYKELAPELRVYKATASGETIAVDQALTQFTHVVKSAAGKIAVVFSATATNETNAALAELATTLNAARFIVGRPSGEGDDILRSSDKNPNTRGAKLAAGDNVQGIMELERALEGEQFSAIIFADGTAELSVRASTIVREIGSFCLADHRTALVEACRYVLPATSWAEELGSYVNRQGFLRVIQPAWRPEQERTPRADLIARLLVKLGSTPSFSSGRELSRRFAEQHNHAELLQLTEDPTAARPTLLRFGHSRG